MIAYLDTSALIKLLLTDEPGGESVGALWQQSDFVMCAEIGYVEARSALARADRGGRLTPTTRQAARTQLDILWAQLDALPVDHALVRVAAELTDSDGLRGYDAVHLAAALTTNATIMASADTALLDAAMRHGLDTTNPLN